MADQQKKQMSTGMVVLLGCFCFLCLIGTMKYTNLSPAIFLALQ